MTAFNADEHAVLTVQTSALIPQRAAISFVQLPQSCESWVMRGEGLEVRGKRFSVTSIPPTVVPFIITTRLPFPFDF